MSLIRNTLLLLGLQVALWGCQTLEQAADAPAPEAKTKASPLAFAWPFLEPEMMVSRGGTSQGTEVTLVTEPHSNWLSLQESGLNEFERDRRGILAMAGDYRTSFQFTETAGFTDSYSPSRPYFSWGTEHVAVIEDTGTFISLQHTLVMYFKDETGTEMGPMVMKHWRQDWTYQDTDLHAYTGNKIWARRRIPEAEATGTWTQSVFQVDDSPRYEVVGRWQHGKQFSAWSSETSYRPLPRREYSVRDDYNVLEGEHRITIVPTGWVHEQHNRKFSQAGNDSHYVAQEVGVNRYERISDPDLSEAERIWNKVGPYWASVRNTWRAIFEEHDRFQLKSDYEGSQLWELHFGHAGEIEQSESFDAARWTEEAKNTIYQFLNTGEAIESSTAY